MFEAFSGLGVFIEDEMGRNDKKEELHVKVEIKDEMDLDDVF